MGPVMSIVVATGNRGKLREIRSLLEALPVEIVSMHEALGEELTIVEDAESFEENALHKARTVANCLQMVTLADDSGLEVDALGGRPGVRSARFAGPSATDAENNALLLEQLQDVDDDQRGARFRCAIALVDPWASEREQVVEGCCEGRIAHAPSGKGGFGYDPLFCVGEHQRTMADLDDDEKNRISHRGQALRQLRPILERLVTKRMEEAWHVLDSAP